MPKITREEVRVPADVMPEARDEYITNYLKATRETGRLMLFACDQKIEHLNSSLALRIECILNQNRNILMTYRINSRRINHLRSKVTKLHRFHIAQLINGIGRTDYTRVCRHETIHIRPYFQAIRIQCRSYDRSGII